MNPVVAKDEAIAAELRALGLTLQRVPGSTSSIFTMVMTPQRRFAEDLDQALEPGRAMAAEAAACRTTRTTSAPEDPFVSNRLDLLRLCISHFLRYQRL